ncbi:MAG: HEPN domain-containing protein [Desulfotomaculum sp.]|nr:HEPN domain-containing protein [Desulfotomaculum sp.]
MRVLKHARRLLTMARKDLRSAHILAQAEVVDDEIVGFHLQQAAEKGLKVWLDLCGEIYPRTHDLSLLLKKLEDIGQEVESFWILLELNSFAVQFRYDIYDEESFEWEEFYHIVSCVLILAEKKLQKMEITE